MTAAQSSLGRHSSELGAALATANYYNSCLNFAYPLVTELDQAENGTFFSSLSFAPTVLRIRNQESLTLKHKPTHSIQLRRFSANLFVAFADDHRQAGLTRPPS